MPERVRVVLVDDHEMWRAGVRADLGDGVEVIGEAGDAESAEAMVAELQPDVVLCDINMPGGGLRVVQSCSHLTHFVMLTVSEAERDLVECIAAGAVGYLLKSTSSEELRNAVFMASRGEPVFTPSMAGLVLGEFRRLVKSSGGTSHALTPREREVLQLVARGRSYKEVASELEIAPKTVENHVGNILAKLKLSRKAELIRFALDNGLD